MGEAIVAMTSAKNVELFEKVNVLTREECEARKNAMLEHYTHIVLTEARVMKEMMQTDVLPAVTAAQMPECITPLKEGILELTNNIDRIHKADVEEGARLSRVLRLEIMRKIRIEVDEMEANVPRHLWTLPTYQDLLWKMPLSKEVKVSL